MSADLTLWATTNCCRCGNHWQHSYVTLTFGGTPNALEQQEGELVNIHQSTRNHKYCFKCAKLTSPTDQLMTSYLKGIE